MLFSLLYMVLRVIFRLAPFRGRAWDYPLVTAMMRAAIAAWA